MKLYQIVNSIEDNNTAGSKAVQDISAIAYEIGFEKLVINNCNNQKTLYAKLCRQIGFAREWENIMHRIENNSILVLQHPFYIRQLNRNRALRKLKKKHVKFIGVVHDVESLRKVYDSRYYKKEFIFMINYADVLIVHNERMAEYFRKLGVPNEKIVLLKIFDYISIDNKVKRNVFEKKITIAGNLDAKKSKYIGKLGRLKNINIDLFGPNFDEKMSSYKNINYKGSFPANEIPQMLTSGFGLVWDGDSIKTCKGNTGEYLKYNNPHKLSLYLSSGLPVIIWKEAAEAEFVLKNGVGIAVQSLYDIEKIFSDMSYNDYCIMQNNVQNVAKKLEQGWYTKNALNNAIEKLCGDNIMI